MFNEHVYNISESDSVASRIATAVRQKIYAIMEENIPLEEMQCILDVGVTADQTHEGSNFFEILYQHKERITALSDQNASWMKKKWPGLRFIHGDGKDMPFADQAFDMVFSSAVLEHVGGRKEQLKFVKECVRVAKHHVFITTPNRWHPIEFHTALPFLHWLPKSLHRKFLDSTGYGMLAQEQHLNLVDQKILADICIELNIASYTIKKVYFIGFASNLLLHIKVDETQL